MVSSANFTNLGAKLDDSQLKLNKDISISFDKEAYAKEKVQKQTKIVGAMERTLNLATMHQYFDIWKEAYHEDLRRKELAKQETERKLRFLK